MSEREKKIIEALNFRRKSQGKSYGNVEPSFQDVANWIDPARGRHLSQGNNGDKRKQQFLIDSTPRKAYRILKSGLMGGLSSPSRPWFKLKLEGFEKPSQPQQAWLDECQRRMYEVLAASNVYNALSQCYGDLGLFGTYAGVLRQSSDNIIHVQSFPVGAFTYAEDEEGIVDTLHWGLKMTVRQLVERFGKDQCSDRVKQMLDRNQLNDTVDVCAAIEPRIPDDPMSPMRTNMPFAVYYWEKASNDKLLEDGGKRISGILAPRWETLVDDPWPISSPGRDALGDVKQLQTQQKDKDTAIQLQYKPPMVGPVEGKMFDWRPGAYNIQSQTEAAKGGIRSAFDARVLDLNGLMMNVQETQGRVMEAFFADLFRMASEYGMAGAKDVTATAIAEMKEEKLITLGPVLESLDRGLLAPLVEGTFHYMQEAEILPEAPPDIVGASVSVEFISLLAQAQRAIGVAAIERTIGFAGTLVQINPGIMDNLDMDATFRDFADQIGFNAGNMRDPQQVEQQREAAAQQAQQQQLMEQAQPLAQAANLLSEASARGNEVLTTQGAL